MSEQSNKSPEIKYVKCPCCGNEVPAGKFCQECGSLLSGEPLPKMAPSPGPAPDFHGISMNNPGGGFISVDSPAPSYYQEEPEEVEDDKDLTLLVDYCRKTVATVGGDGYDETVLYRNGQTGEYSIHTYSKYVYMQKEKHRSFKAKEGVAEAVFKLIEDLKLADYKGKTGFGLCGGEYVVKFRKGDEIIRISTGNMGYEGLNALCSVGNMLASYIIPKDNQ